MWPTSSPPPKRKKKFFSLRHWNSINQWYSLHNSLWLVHEIPSYKANISVCLISGHKITFFPTWQNWIKKKREWWVLHNDEFKTHNQKPVNLFCVSTGHLSLSMNRKKKPIGYKSCSSRGFDVLASGYSGYYFPKNKNKFHCKFSLNSMNYVS